MAVAPYVFKWVPPAVVRAAGSVAGGAFLAVLAFLDRMLGALFGNVQPLVADAVCYNALPANTYANGTSGVGATLTANANGVFPTIDGVTPAVGQFYLVAGEGNAPSSANNGLYQLTTLGSATTAWVLTRATTLDQSAEFLQGLQVGIKGGTVFGGSSWGYVGAASPTMGSTVLAFAPNPSAALNMGSIPSARMAASVNPTAADIICTIAGKQFKCVAALGAADTTVQVLRGGSAAATYANLVNAINGDAASAGTGWLESTAPFTTAVVADLVTATLLRVMLATARGGKAIAGTSPSITLAAAVTGGAAAWTTANLNETGNPPGARCSAVATKTITAGNITAARADFDFPFPVGKFSVQAYSSGGVQRAYSDVTAASGNTVTITLGGGVSPNLQANDVVTVEAFQ